MKKSILMLSLSVVTLGAYAMNNNQSEITSTTAYVTKDSSVVEEENKKVEIESAKLLESTKKAIAENYKGASIQKAYEIYDTQNVLVGYEVVIIKEDKKEETVKFDKTGAWVK